MKDIPPPFPDARTVLRIVMPSRIEEREHVIRDVLDAAAVHGFEVDPHFHRLCIDEALINSVVHGNENDHRKVVEVIVYSSLSRWGVDIVDQGSGFDWQTWLERLREGLEDDRLTGRGLELILKSGAQVEFLEGGRRLRMVWKRDNCGAGF